MLKGGSRSHAERFCKVDIGDAELHTQISGVGPTLLLVPGLGGRGAFWKHQIAALADHFEVITFDHRGCGKSSPDLLTTGIAQLANDVVALLDALKIEKATLVGHSTGGAIGQHIAMEQPSRLDRLVLSSTWAGPDPYFIELFRVRRNILEKCGVRDYLSSGIFLAMPGAGLQTDMHADQAAIEERVAAFPGLEVELSRIDTVVRHDLRARLGEIAAETFCISAMDDQITPPGFTKELAESIPDARIHLFARGGHFVPIAAHQEYTECILDFLLDRT